METGDELYEEVLDQPLVGVTVQIRNFCEELGTGSKASWVR